MDDKKKRPAFYSDFSDGDAAGYHGWYLEPPGSEIAREQKRALGAVLGPGRGRALCDIGCGTGLFSEWFQSQGFAVTGIDSSAAMLALARKHCPACASFQLADAARLPFKDASFDIATFVTSLEFVGDTRAALAQAVRVARRGLVCLLLDPGHHMNAERKRKAEASGGVFQNARLWAPADLEPLVREAARGKCTVAVHGHCPQSPYYILETTLQNETP